VAAMSTRYDCGSAALAAIAHASNIHKARLEGLMARMRCAVYLEANRVATWDMLTCMRAYSENNGSGWE
jgi:hypothetical protein